MKDEHDAEIARLRSNMGAASADEIEKLKAKHAAEIKELK